jgi:hypothetical protein
MVFSESVHQLPLYLVVLTQRSVCVTTVAIPADAPKLSWSVYDGEVVASEKYSSSEGQAISIRDSR